MWRSGPKRGARGERKVCNEEKKMNGSAWGKEIQDHERKREYSIQRLTNRHEWGSGCNAGSKIQYYIKKDLKASITGTATVVKKKK